MSSHGSLLFVHTEKDAAVVSSSSYKDTSPRGLGPHPYDLNDLRNLFEGLTSIYYHTGVRSLIYEFVGVGEDTVQSRTEDEGIGDPLWEYLFSDQESFPVFLQ